MRGFFWGGGVGLIKGWGGRRNRGILCIFCERWAGLGLTLQGLFCSCEI